MQRKDFIDVKRIVIKLGTNVLRNNDGEVALSRIYSFIEDISKLVKDNKEVIIVYPKITKNDWLTVELENRLITVHARLTLCFSRF